MMSINNTNGPTLNTVYEQNRLLAERLSIIEKDIAETKEVFLKIWAFIETMKDNPMLAAMTGGLAKPKG
ncbi:MAG: hypothetical protein AB7I44_21135 [Hyphomicrobiaceae bacterium]